MTTCLAVFSAALLWGGCSAYHETFRLAAYVKTLQGPWFPEYQMHNLDWGRVSQRATDLVLFSVEPTADGELLLQDRLPHEAMAAAREARDHHGARLHVCVGGPERSGGFLALLAEPARRAKLVAGLAKMVIEEQLDGVDFAWSGGAPVEPGVEYVYGELISDLRSVVKASEKYDRPRRLEVTVMAHPGEFHSNAFREADFVHLMSFDNCTAESPLPCRHATYDDAVANVEQFIGRGLPAKKLVLGIPAYGRSMDAPAEVKTYDEILKHVGPLSLAADEALDQRKQKKPTWYFNGVATAVKKTDFAVERGLGGVFLWTAGQDAQVRSFSLLAALQDAKRQERHKTLEKNRKREEQAEVRRQKNKKVRVEKEQTKEKKKLGRPINKDDL